MLPHPKPFLGLEPDFSDYAGAAAVVLPYPYEGGISYGAGAAAAPSAVLEASLYLELYDEDLRAEPYRMGIATVRPPADPPVSPEAMVQDVYELAVRLLKDGKFIGIVGGDHSISSGFFRALRDRAGARSVIQLDAHADLRDSYEGRTLSHACAMARIRELTPHTLQLGIRSMSAEEAARVKRENLPLFTMSDLNRDPDILEKPLGGLPEPVFVTVDADVFDWGVISSTGTPEPGGLFWREAVALLHRIFRAKEVAGFDVVELAYQAGDRNSPFAVAKLIYKMLGFKLESHIRREKRDWPQAPAGPILF
jgi:agmatinase